ncbi:hypothetical protein M8994_16325 [Brucella sp. 21LCYQ03]|nr:hypothetical protein [Brucella sp. 21LCYQ03]
MALPTNVTMGSAVRAKGVLQEFQLRLAASSKKLISHERLDLSLAMAANEKAALKAAAAIATITDAEALPVIPREIEDSLTLKTCDRYRWVADGRARPTTFHVFDPQVVEDLLDRGSVDQWREDDAGVKTKKRQKTAC